jgi:hypothetical protein
MDDKQFDMDAIREAYRKACASDTLVRVDAYDRAEPWELHPADVDIAEMVDLHPFGGETVGVLVARTSSAWMLTTGAEGIPGAEGSQVQAYGVGIGAGTRGEILMVTAAAGPEDEDGEGDVVGFGTTFSTTAARAFAAALLRMADEADGNAETYQQGMQTSVALHLADVLREAGVSFDPEDVADVGGAVAQAVSEDGDVTALTQTGRPVTIRKMTDEQAARIAAGEDISEVLDWEDES